MNGDATNGIGAPIRQLRTLFTLGTLGALDDARLIQIFVEWTGSDAEDAFAAIVRRHGPMVLGVCRRMLANPSDADDAFQATFLILARRAAWIGRKEQLANWLHGVAVRSAREIKRRDARRQRREEQTMRESRIESAPVDDHADLIPLLDEELARLPERYRTALLACEIEGKSRSEAARQLGISEGTLSSRLARGRKMLRDRLAARGVGLGALPFADAWPGLPATHLPESLATATTRAAIGSGSAGTASAAVLTIAETILKTMLLAKLKAGLVAAVAIGIGSILTVTFAAGPNTAGLPTPASDPPKSAAKAPAKTKGVHDPRYARIRGVVVDEAGKPVPGIKVSRPSFLESWPSGTTDAAGKFDFDSGFAKVEYPFLLATTADGSRQGIYQDSTGVTTDDADVRIILKPIRKLVVRVADRDKQPVAGASVEIFAGRWSNRLIADGKTDTSGAAILRIPADAKVRLVTALKSRLGFDYDLFWRGGDAHPWKEAPDTVGLVLDGARTVTVKAVDSSGRPILDVPIYPWIFRKEGKGIPEGEIDATMKGNADVNMSGSRAVFAKTDGRGIATFDWLPEMKRSLQFLAVDRRFDSPYTVLQGELRDTSLWGRARRALEDVRAGVSAWTNGATLTMRLLRTETIRGRVTRPDGRPAAGILLRADGVELERIRTGHRSRTEARTAADGTYEILAYANHVYAVSLIDDDWAAPTRFRVIVNEGKPAEGVDFRLQRGTLLHGTLTEGADRKPKVGETIFFIEPGEWPSGIPNPHNVAVHWMERWTPQTDARGHYSIRVGPGIFEVNNYSSDGWKSDTINVTDEDVLEHDIHVP